MQSICRKCTPRFSLSILRSQLRYGFGCGGRALLKGIAQRIDKRNLCDSPLRSGECGGHQHHEYAELLLQIFRHSKALGLLRAVKVLHFELRIRVRDYYRWKDWRQSSRNDALRGGREEEWPTHVLGRRASSRLPCLRCASEGNQLHLWAVQREFRNHGHPV